MYGKIYLRSCHKYEKVKLTAHFTEAGATVVFRQQNAGYSSYPQDSSDKELDCWTDSKACWKSVSITKAAACCHVISNITTETNVSFSNKAKK